MSKLQEYRYKKRIDKYDSDELALEMVDQKNDIVELQHSIEDMMAKTDELIKFHDKQKKDSHERENQLLKNAKRDLENIAKQNIELNNRQVVLSNKYKNEIKEKDDEIANIELEKEKEFNRQKEHLTDEFEQEKKLLEDKLKEVDKNKKALIDKYDNDVLEIKEQYERIKKQQFAIIDSLKSQIAKENADFDASILDIENNLKKESEKHSKDTNDLYNKSTETINEINSDGESNVELLKNELLALFKQKEALKTQCANLEKQYNIQEEEIKEEYRKQSWHFEQIKNQANERRNNAEKEYQSKYEEYEQVVAKLQAELEAKNELAKKHYAQLELQKEGKKSENASTKEKLSADLKNDLNSVLNSYVTKIQNIKNDFDAKINRLKNEIASNEEALNKQVLDLNYQKDKLISNYEKELSEIKADQDDYRQLFKDKKEKYEAEIKIKKDECKEIKRKNELEYQEISQSLALKLAALKQEWSLKKEELLKRIKDEKNNIFEINANITSNEERMRNSRLDIDSKKADLEHQIKLLNDEKDTFIAKKDTLIANQAQLEEEFNKQCGLIEEEKEKATSKYNDEIDEINKTHQHMMGIINQEYQNKLADLQKQHELDSQELQKKYEEKVLELNDSFKIKTVEVEEEKAKINHDIETIKQEFAEKIEHQKQISQDVLNSIDDSKVEFENEIAALEHDRLEQEKIHNSRVHSLYAEFDTKHRALIEENNTEVQNYKDETARMAKELADIQNEYDAKQKSYEKEINDFEDYKKNANHELVKLDSVVKNVRSQFEELVKQNENVLADWDKKIASKNKELELLMTKQDAEIKEYKCQREKEANQYESSLNASIKSRKDAYELSILQKSKNIEIQNQSIRSEYEQKIRTLDEELDDLNKQKNDIFEQEGANYQKAIDETSEILAELENIKSEHAKEMFNVKKRFSALKNEKNEEIENLKAGYKSTLDEYVAKYEEQSLKREAEKAALAGEIDRIKKDVTFLTMTIASFRKDKEFEKAVLENEMAILIKKKNEEIDLINSQREKAISEFEAKVSSQKGIFENIEQEIKKVFADKPLVFAKLYDRFNEVMNEHRQNYKERYNELKNAHVLLLEELENEQSSFIDEIKSKMEYLLEFKKQQIAEDEQAIIELVDDFVNKKSSENTKQNLARLNINEENQAFDNFIKQVFNDESNLESDYENSIDELNRAFEESKLKLQTKMQEETIAFDEEINGLQAQKQNELDKIENIKRSIETFNNEYDNSICELSDRFIAKCEELEKNISDKLVEQRREIEEKDLLGNEINPFFSSRN